MAKVEKMFEQTINQMKQVEIEAKKNELSTRLTGPYKPITKVQDQIFPAVEALNFEN